MWKTTVGFVDFGTATDEVIILGHGGYLDFFTAVFDGESAVFELIPNALLPTWTCPRNHLNRLNHPPREFAALGRSEFICAASPPPLCPNRAGGPFRLATFPDDPVINASQFGAR